MLRNVRQLPRIYLRSMIDKERKDDLHFEVWIIQSLYEKSQYYCQSTLPSKRLHEVPNKTKQQSVSKKVQIGLMEYSEDL